MSLSHPNPLAPLAILGVASLAGILSWGLRPQGQPPAVGTPKKHVEDGYIGASACQACHPGGYDSWSHTYHSTMTRPVARLLDGSTDQVPDLPVELKLDGVKYELTPKRFAIIYTGPDLDHVGKKLAQLRQLNDASPSYKRKRAVQAFRDAPQVTRRLSLVTGSHHYLAFWVSSGPARPLRQFPFVFFLDERRWIARREAFLQPADALPHVARFNANCIQCHTVAGRPQQKEGVDLATGEFWETYSSDVADWGISCEACHGPGAQHARSYQNPWARLQASLSSSMPSDGLFVPHPEAPGSSAAACGQCHSYFLPKDPDIWWERGFSGQFHPGQSLSDSRTVIPSPVANEGDPAQTLALLSASSENLFWEEGGIMIGGREYNGLIESPCYQDAAPSKRITCVSCHSMHQGTRSGQMKKDLTSPNQNQMCEQCHTVAPEHSGHTAESPGALCANCHMPKTSYALLSAIVSHQITTPAPVASSSKRSAPHPCMLCHTDQSKDWILEQTRSLIETGRWSSLPSTSQSNSIPWAVERALRGNAAVRAVLVSALSNPQALRTAGRQPFDAVSGTLQKDSYPAIRHMTRRAIARLPLESSGAEPEAAAPAWELSPHQLNRLVELQDRTPIVISE